MAGEWERFPPDPEASPSPAWYKRNVSFVPTPNKLQTLDLWVPSSSETPPRSLTERKGLWVIYIHGGAWRDPLVTSSSFTPTVSYLLDDNGTKDTIAGIASINYSLSPHPNHPSEDPSRKARHPDHIKDVLSALTYLQKLAGFGSDYVLLGHSCGATLAFQVLMDPKHWSILVETDVVKPRAVVGLNGLYDLPGLVDDAGPDHERWRALYAEFIIGAFGDDREVWNDVSPTYTPDWNGIKEQGVKTIVVGQSKEDTLVPYNQAGGLLHSLSAIDGSVDVKEVSVTGDHNVVWEEGKQIAEIVANIMKAI